MQREKCPSGPGVSLSVRAGREIWAHGRGASMGVPNAQASQLRRIDGVGWVRQGSGVGTDSSHEASTHQLVANGAAR